MNDLRANIRPVHTLSSSKPRVKLLIPIDGSERARWGLQYARARARRGDELSVELLFVAEPIQNWQVLRFWTRRQVASFQSERGHFLLEDAERFLREAGIPVQSHFREGDAAYQILDAAQALNCQEIVLPAPEQGWLHRLDRNIAREIQGKHPLVRLVVVDAKGLPCAVPVRTQWAPKASIN